jgi:hypothetical protein
MSKRANKTFLERPLSTWHINPYDFRRVDDNDPKDGDAASNLPRLEIALKW